MSDRIRAALQRLTELEGHTLVDCTADWAEAMIEARAALAAEAVVVEEVTDEALQRTRDEEREACCRWVIENLDLYDPKWVANQLRAHRLGAIAADRVRQTHHTILVPAPMPAPPAAGEVGELVEFLRDWGDDYADEGTKWHRAADLLERQAAPVPVAERLQQLEDLAADAVSGLRYIEQTHGRLYGVGWDRVYEKADRLQPGHALPLPAGEVGELVALLRYEAREADLDLMTTEQCHRAADLLERHPAPVPVSERLPGPEDCDAEGFCWFWSPEDQCWFWERQDSTFCRNYGTEFRWLPATALPLPQGEVQP